MEAQYNIQHDSIETCMSHAQYKGEVRINEPMARHTSWRAGGVARRYLMPADLQDLQAMLRDLPHDEPLLWLGLGSNLLVRDGGFNGSVIAMQGVTSRLELSGGARVVVGAGVAGAKLARFCARNGLYGAEFFAGIPGLVGGALAMNAGAFGGETWEHVLNVQTINRNGEIKQREPGDYQVGYRSVSGPRDEWFIEATLQFSKQPQQANTVDIKQLLAKRAATQPTGAASCGSVFRNPEGDHAARLIEQCGLKGKRIGGAVVSEKHANFIINDQQASAADIEALIHLVQHTVADQTGVQLQTEVRIVGDPA